VTKSGRKVVKTGLKQAVSDSFGQIRPGFMGVQNLSGPGRIVALLLCVSKNHEKPSQPVPDPVPFCTVLTTFSRTGRNRAQGRALRQNCPELSNQHALLASFSAVSASFRPCSVNTGRGP